MSNASDRQTQAIVGDEDHVATELHGGGRLAGRPERIGPYRLLDLLGEGGMGTVYLAEQSEPLPRRVALKLMRWSDAGGEAIRRFELEREAMARMHHPAIAQVFDAGATEHGQPYVVLEHIPGLPITDYCDHHRLGLRQRLELLATVCDGVRHAHEKGVIHRDLKPSNILVMDGANGPVPKIIDFGIAKALAPWSPTSDSKTRTRARVGSPGYMSPEAMLDGSRAIDTRSDVYSLGVVLSELLIGVRPFANKRPTMRQIRDATDDPQLPSERWRALPADQRRQIAEARGLDEPRLVRALRSELDWVVLRAIATDPDRRYGSAAELASDIGRWATGRLVEARPPSVLYRTRKIVQRHAPAVAAAMLVAVMLIGFGIRTKILQTRAETARLQAEELVAFMLDDLNTRLEPLGRLDLLEAVSRESLAYFESVEGADLERAGRRPAAALRQIGEVLMARGDVDAAQDAFDRATQIDRRRLDDEPTDPSRRVDLARDLAASGRVQDARGAAADAALTMDRARELLREVLDSTPDHPDASLVLAQILTDQAGVYRALDDIESAAAAYREAQAIAERLAASSPEGTVADDATVRHLLGSVHYGRGLSTLYSLGDAKAAIDDFTQAISVYRDLADRQPEVPKWRYRLAVLYGQGLVTSHSVLDQGDAARRANEQALRLLEQLVREEPGQTRWAHALGWELVRSGGLARDAGEAEQAAESFRRAAEVQETVIARSGGHYAQWLDGLAVAYESLAIVHYEAEDYAAALEVAEIGLAARRRMPGMTPDEPADAVFSPRFASSAVDVAELRWRTGDSTGALALLAEAGELIRRLVSPQVESSDMREALGIACINRGELLRELGRSNEADEALALARDLLEPLDASDPWIAELKAAARGESPPSAAP